MPSTVRNVVFYSRYYDDDVRPFVDIVVQVSHTRSQFNGFMLFYRKRLFASQIFFHTQKWFFFVPNLDFFLPNLGFPPTKFFWDENNPNLVRNNPKFDAKKFWYEKTPNLTTTFWDKRNPHAFFIQEIEKHNIGVGFTLDVYLADSLSYLWPAAYSRDARPCPTCTGQHRGTKM